MSQNLVIRRRAELLEAEVDGEIVALHVESGNCYGFNATASRVWTLIEQPRSVAELREALMAEYEIDADTCERQLDELLAELERDGLIAREAAPAA